MVKEPGENKRRSAVPTRDRSQVTRLRKNSRKWGEKEARGTSGENHTVLKQDQSEKKKKEEEDKY